MRVIFLIIIGFSTLLYADFSKANGVVTDTITKLEWQDDYSDNGGTIKKTTWSEAINYCEALSLDGKSDWRLPNINELISLVDDTRYAPAINTVFENTISFNSGYWSSTARANVSNSSSAWYIAFVSGQRNTAPKGYGYTYCVRCVRAGE